MLISEKDISLGMVVTWDVMNGEQPAIWRKCGERIGLLRKRMGISQEKLAERIARIDPSVTFGQSQMSNIEKATSMPTAPTLRALAQVLETNTDYLLGLTDDDRPPSDLEDQVVATVEDSRDRALVQEVADLMAHTTHEQRVYVAGLVRRLLGPGGPHIIGG